MIRGWIKYLNIVLCILAAFLLVNIFFFIKNYDKESASASVLPDSAKTESLAETGKTLSDYAIIYRRNLFNVSEASKPLASSSQPLSLKLKGTVVGSDEFTFCIIEDKAKRKDELYQKGDKIQDMQVNEITANSVVLMKGAEKIVLYIDENNKEIEAAPKTVVAAPAALDFSSIENPEPNMWVLSREDVVAATRNISQIMSDLKIRPNFSDGKMEGFKVDDITEGSVALAMGIRKGDVVKSINGEVIDSPRKIFEFYRNLERSPSIQLEVARGDSTETLTYKIKE